MINILICNNVTYCFKLPCVRKKLLAYYLKKTNSLNNRMKSGFLNLICLSQNTCEFHLSFNMIVNNKDNKIAVVQIVEFVLFEKKAVLLYYWRFFKEILISDICDTMRG